MICTTLRPSVTTRCTTKRPSLSQYVTLLEAGGTLTHGTSMATQNVLRMNPICNCSRLYQMP